MSTSQNPPCRILIVEDESVVAMDLESSLERLGYTVSGSATTGEEALHEMQRNRPDLVLMDIQLQGPLEGLSTAETIHDQFAIPVVFVTANVSSETIARAGRTGSYGFLNKPFRISELNATIQIALQQHEEGKAHSAERDQLQKQVHLTSSALGRTKEELHALWGQLLNAQEEERSRIARELHDDLGQQAALLGMRTDLLLEQLSAEQLERGTTIRAGLRTLAQGLREVSHKLHPAILSDLGLTDALELLVEEFRAQGMALRASLARADNMPTDVSTALYRIAQESLQNALKHAPACNVRLSLHMTSKHIQLQIADNGPGIFLPEVKRGDGLGLISMQERANMIGGKLQLTTKRGEGTTVTVQVALPGLSSRSRASVSRDAGS